MTASRSLRPPSDPQYRARRTRHTGETSSQTANENGSCFGGSVAGAGAVEEGQHVTGGLSYCPIQTPGVLLNCSTLPLVCGR